MIVFRRRRRRRNNLTGDRELLLELYRSAIAGADPFRITTSLLKQLQPPASHRRVWLFAFGKAAQGMSNALAHWLGEGGRIPLRGVVVSTGEPQARIAGLDYLVGDHPIPERNSQAASDRIHDVVSEVGPGDQVYVLISGGTTSLIGSPVDGLSDEEYRSEFRRLLGSGSDIHAMNAVRKRISRWGDGRLALAMRHASVQPIIISDVLSDDPAVIGSGPCSSVSYSDSLAHVAEPLLATHKLPALATLRAARERGLDAVHANVLTGEASETGRSLARDLLVRASHLQRPVVVVAGGETTVTLNGSHGRGGRCQELALAAAEVLAEAPDSRVALLAAGTDGRDGPTDAAGAIVDGSTWTSIRAAGRDPFADLAAHDSYAALQSADALIHTGLTGTNMLDVAIAVVRSN